MARKMSDVMRRKSLRMLGSDERAVILSSENYDLAEAVDGFLKETKRVPDRFRDYLTSLINQSATWMDSGTDEMFRSQFPWKDFLFVDKNGELPDEDNLKMFVRIRNRIYGCCFIYVRALFRSDIEDWLKDRILKCSFGPEADESLYNDFPYKEDAAAETLLCSMFGKGMYYRELFERLDMTLDNVIPLHANRANAPADIARKFVPFGRYDKEAEDAFFERYSRRKDDYIVETALSEKMMDEIGKLGIDAEIKNMPSICTHTYYGHESMSVDVKEAPYTHVAPERNPAGPFSANAKDTGKSYRILAPGTFSLDIGISVVQVYSFSTLKARPSGSRHYPDASLADIATQMHKSKTARSFWIKYFNEEARYNPFLKEIKSLALKWADGEHKTIGLFSLKCAPENSFPVSMTKAVRMHNWNEYFRSYRNAGLLDVNFNKLPPEVSYAALNVVSRIKKEDISLFRDFVVRFGKKYRSGEERKLFYYRAGRQFCDILVYYYMDRLSGIDETNYDSITIHDYIRLEFLNKRKLSLTPKSIQTIRDLHDEANTQSRLKEMPEVKVRKKSVFNQLRKLLPNEYEWITDKARLAKESKLQSHCVWTYASSINEDRCAIYSYVNPENGERHTIEVNYINDEYYVAQIRKKYNAIADISVVKSLYKYLGAQAMRGFKCRLKEMADNSEYELLSSFEEIEEDPFMIA